MITSNKQNIPLNSLVSFFLIAFGLTWGIAGLFIFLPQQMTSIFGKLTGQHPLFYLATYSPAIAAFIIVTYYSGLNGLRRFLSRLLIWRCSPIWYVFLIVGIPLVFYAGAAFKGTFFTEPFPFASFDSLIAAMLYMVIKGPVEEFGWRGLALPLLQRKMAPIWAGLVIGVIWGFWHVPAFLLSGAPQSGWSFVPFFLGTIALSVIVTPLFNASRGSILLPVFFHFLLVNPAFPDAQPYDTYLFMVVAVLVVWFNRKTMLNKEGAITEVVPQKESRGS